MQLVLHQSHRMPFHTDVAVVLKAFAGAQSQFEWIVTDAEPLPGAHGLPEALRVFVADSNQGAVLRLGGQELTEMLTRQPVQFSWGVFSAFPPGAAPDPLHLDPYPYANGNAMVGRPGATIQHPDAVVELTCFDSTFTSLIARDPELGRRFLEYFPESTVLDP